MGSRGIGRVVSHGVMAALVAWTGRGRLRGGAHPHLGLRAEPALGAPWSSLISKRLAGICIPEQGTKSFFHVVPLVRMVATSKTKPACTELGRDAHMFAELAAEEGAWHTGVVSLLRASLI